MRTNYNLVEVWLSGETNNIGPYPSFDAAIQDAGKRLRGYSHNAPLYTRVTRPCFDGVPIPVATVRVSQSRYPITGKDSYACQ